MTENKRFVLLDNNDIKDTQLNILLDGGMDSKDMVELLNELHEENIRLRNIIHQQSIKELPIEPVRCKCTTKPFKGE